MGPDFFALILGTGSDKPIYQIADHLGSVRVIKDGAGNVLQRFNYYPFGSESRVWTAGTNPPQSAIRYRFGGKEIAGQRVSASALAGAPAAAAGSPYLDFGARLYDPRTAAWLSQDLLSEKYYSISPYAYCAGNPVIYIDEIGAEFTDYYSIQGKLLLHVDDGLDNIFFVLSGADVSSAIEKEEIFPLPSIDLISKYKEAEKLTSKDNHERGFRVGENGMFSDIVKGSKTEISSEQWKSAIDYLRNHNTLVLYDVHTHPKDVEGSTNIPSKTDMMNTVGRAPNVVIGYNHIIYETIDYSGHSSISHSYEPQIVFYNKQGIIDKPHSFNSFLKTVARLNKNR